MKKGEINWEVLGGLIDRIGNLNGAMKLCGLPDSIHMQGIRGNLPEIEEELKKFFISASGENPWD